MRKSGLHKQIASIFDGAPVPKHSAKASLTTKQADAAEESNTTDKSVARLLPVPKSASAAQPSLLKKISFLGLSKTPQGSNADASQRRQKTMTALVGVLSVVFIGVMSISLGGIGQTKAAPVPVDEPAAVVVEEKPQFDPQSWAFPNPLPAQMRNPMVIPKAPEPPVVVVEPVPEVQEPVEAEAAAEVPVEETIEISGIVYSEKKPTVLINGQVVFEGQAVNGATILKISRNAVEFEKDGRQWTRHVW
jgi:hypothetical protein